MKILLIVPPNSAEERYGRLSDVGTLYPPLGLAYVAAVAERQGEVKVLDSEAMNYSFRDIEEITKRFNPDVVGMPTYSTTMGKCYRTAEIIKGINKDIKIVLGGAQATLEPEKTLSNNNIDFVIYGEGEFVFENLLIALKNNTNLENVKSLAWKKNGKIVINPPLAIMKDLDVLPMPARHLFPMERYHSSANLRGNKTLNIMTSRGCPYRCAYCAGGLIFGKTSRCHSTDRVIAEIREMKEKYGVDGIQFYDETFTTNKKRIIELCRGIIKEGIKIDWSCFTRVNLIDKELLYWMKTAGCYQIFYGLESGVQRLLDLINKDITLEQSRNAIKMTHEAGIDTLASFMIGLPSETVEESEQTINFAIEVNPTFAQFPFTTPYPGTRLYDLGKEHGRFMTENLDDYTTWNVVFVSTKDRTAEEIKNTVRKAYRKFYLRPSAIFTNIRSVLKLPPKKVMSLGKSFLSTVTK